MSGGKKLAPQSHNTGDTQLLILQQISSKVDMWLRFPCFPPQINGKIDNPSNKKEHLSSKLNCKTSPQTIRNRNRKTEISHKPLLTPNRNPTCTRHYFVDILVFTNWLNPQIWGLLDYMFCFLPNDPEKVSTVDMSEHRWRFQSLQKKSWRWCLSCAKPSSPEAARRAIFHQQ